MSDGVDEFEDAEEEELEEGLLAKANKEENAEPENPFTQEMVPECLSMLCKIGNGLAHAYVRMDCHDRQLTDISHMQKFIHVRYVDVSGNELKDLSSLNHLTHLLALKANKNKLNTLGLETRPYLQIVDLSENKLASFEGLNHPQLARLNLNSNAFLSCEGLDAKMLTNLHTLELRGNKLIDFTGMVLPNLHTLYLAANQIKSLEGVSRMKSLRKLHIRENQIENLDGFDEDMAKLEYINMRGNDIKEVKEVEKLQCLPSLKILLLAENPCSSADNYRIEVLLRLRKLKRIDKDEVTSEELVEADELFKSRKEEEEQEDEYKDPEDEETQ